MSSKTATTTSADNYFFETELAKMMGVIYGYGMAIMAWDAASEAFISIDLNNSTSAFTGIILATLIVFMQWICPNRYYPSEMVNLFALCLMWLPTMGLDNNTLGGANGTYGCRLFLASAAVTWTITKVMELMCAAVESVVTGITNWVTGACRSVDQAATTAATAVETAIVNGVTRILSFRKCIAAIVIVASLAYPTVGALAMCGLAIWIFVELVMAVVAGVQWIYNSVCAAGNATKNAAIQSANHVETTVSEALDAVEAWLKAMIASICQGICKLVANLMKAICHGVMAMVSLALSYRKCTWAFVLLLALAYPIFGVVVVAGIAVWMTCRLVDAVVYIVKCAMNLGCAAVVAATKAATHAIDAMTTAISTAVSVMRSLLLALFWGFVSFVMSALTVILMAALEIVKIAAVLIFLANPCWETFLSALLIKAYIAFVKYLVHTAD